ncbi:MAG: acyl-CoA/acyl-ACP dehydrogenase [Chitinophagaceae bacterium]|nr:acyl-CoA/acyl-ACP dehydrogenase [Anaerolineae bacterium]
MNFSSTSSFLFGVRDYCEQKLAGDVIEIDRSDTIPPRVYADLASLRLFAFASLGDQSEALPVKMRTELLFECLSIIAETSAAVAKAVMDQNFGQIGMMREYGNSTIQGKLEQIRTGAKQAAFLMTEPQSGSDLSLFATTFKWVEGGVSITGVKDWITGAAQREFFVTLAKEAGTVGTFGVFLIDRGMAAPDSIRVLDRKNKLGLRGLGEYRVELDSVFVPSKHIIIQPGPGVIRKVMSHYNLKRCGQAAIAIGTARSALRAAYNYLQNRFQPEGGIPFQNTLFVFADLYSRLAAAETLPYSAAGETINGDKTGVPASIAKYVCTELAVETTSTLSQLCGGNGLSDKLPLERQMRDMRMLTVAGGASEVLKATIAKNLDSLLTAPVVARQSLPKKLARNKARILATA